MTSTFKLRQNIDLYQSSPLLDIYHYEEHVTFLLWCFAAILWLLFTFFCCKKKKTHSCNPSLHHTPFFLLCGLHWVS